jgi:3-oxoacyl-[acyl-carrier protein] reductase
VDVTINARDAAALEATATALSGGPPFRDFRQLDREAMFAGLAMNMVTTIALVAATIDRMIERRFGRIVNITSLSVKMPVAGLDLSSGARAGLTAFVAGIARTVAPHNVTINNLLPGFFETDCLRAGFTGTAQLEGRTAEEIAAERVQEILARLFGDPAEFGDACAFLCSAQSGYITGQNLLIDGGRFPAAF